MLDWNWDSKLKFKSRVTGVAQAWSTVLCIMHGSRLATTLQMFVWSNSSRCLQTVHAQHMNDGLQPPQKYSHTKSTATPKAQPLQKHSHHKVQPPQKHSHPKSTATPRVQPAHLKQQLWASSLALCTLLWKPVWNQFWPISNQRLSNQIQFDIKNTWIWNWF